MPLPRPLVSMAALLLLALTLPANIMAFLPPPSRPLCSRAIVPTTKFQSQLLSSSSSSSSSCSWSTRSVFDADVDQVNEAIRQIQDVDHVAGLYNVVCDAAPPQTPMRAMGIALAAEIDGLRSTVRDQEMDFGRALAHAEKEAYKWRATAAEAETKALELRVRMLEKDVEAMREEIEELWEEEMEEEEEESDDDDDDDNEGGYTSNEDYGAVFDEDEEDLEEEEKAEEQMKEEKEDEAWTDLGPELEAVRQEEKEDKNEEEEKGGKGAKTTVAEAMHTDHWQIGGMEAEEEDLKRQESFAACEGCEGGTALEDCNEIEAIQPEDMVPKWAEEKAEMEGAEKAAEVAAATFHEEEEPSILVNLERLAQKLEE